jgi:hypothetical protein
MFVDEAKLMQDKGEGQGFSAGPGFNPMKGGWGAAKITCIYVAMS